MARSSLVFALGAPLLLVACSSGDPGGARDAGPLQQDGSGDGQGGGDGAGDPDGDPAAAPRGSSAYFPRDSFFTEDVYDAPKAAHSEATIAALRAAGGWGNGDFFQIDFSMEVLTGSAATPTRTFTPRTEDNGFEWDEFFTPDCDSAPIPLPEGGNLEGEAGYACDGDGDCHLIVWLPDEQRLYEAWRAHLDGSEFVSGCLAVWDTSQAVGERGRGLQCTSADAAGFPIAPLLFTADEVAAGEIPHAIRFILPNDRVQRGFVPPATHATDTTGPAGAPYYGVHLRLRRDYPLDSLPGEGARVVARALQRYGMFHADGGNIALTAQSDRRTTAKWDGLLGPHDLGALTVEDFEVIDHGSPSELTYECARE